MSVPPSVQPAGNAQPDWSALLLNVSQALCDGEEPERLLGQVAECAGKAVGASNAIIVLLSEDGQTLRVGGAYSDGGCPVPELGATFPAARIIGDMTLLADTHPVFLEADLVQIFATARSHTTKESPATAGLFLIAVRGAVLGALIVLLPGKGANPGPAGLRVCQAVCKQLAAALSAARSSAAYERRLSRIAAEAGLVQMVLDGKGLPALAAALEDLLGNHVVVIDPVFHLLAYSPNEQGTDRHRREALRQGGLPKRYCATRAFAVCCSRWCSIAGRSTWDVFPSMDGCSDGFKRPF